MIRNRSLTEAERRKSQRNYNLYSLVNGASYACLGETVVILFAIKQGATNMIIAILGSMLYLGYLLLPLGILRMRVVGAARSQADFWVWRNIAALAVTSSVWFRMYSEILGWFVFITGCFLFYGFRAAGVVTALPLLGEISSDRDRMMLLGTSSALFHFSSMFSLIVITLLLGWCDSMGTLVGMIVTGACMGICSSSFLRRIDENESLRVSARAPLLPLMREAMKNRNLRHQIYASAFFNIALIMLAPISVAALKKGCGVSDKLAVIFTMVQCIAAIVASKLISPVTKKIGTGNLAFCAWMLIFPVCAFWIAGVPYENGFFQKSLYAIPFFLTGTLSVFCNNAMYDCFLKTVPQKKQVAYSMFINVISGVAASLCAMVLAGTILKISESTGAGGMNMYRIYFALTSVLLLPGFFLIRKFKKDLCPR